MEAEGLSVSVAGRELVHDATFHIERGQRVALIGRNGAGKTTLLETLLGRRPAEHGRAKLGHGVSLAYYSQQSLELPEQARLVDAVGHGTKLTGPQARMLLGRFLFSGDQVEKPVSVLSGGERRRLALARIVVSGANLLVLDEPTNHLDIESREALEDALDSFPGTILFVSHDRALIEALATRTIAIEDGRLRLRDGAFGEYARDHEPVVAKDPPRQAPPKPKQPRPAAGQGGRAEAGPQRPLAARGAGAGVADRAARGGAGSRLGTALPARRLPGPHRCGRGWSPPPAAPGGAGPPVPRVGAAGGLTALTIRKTGCRIDHGPQCATPTCAIDATPPGAAGGADADDDARAGGTAGLRMDVAAVAFPGDAFEAAASELRPCLVVVDVTYLDEARVRPLMIDRFSRKGPVLVFVSESGHAWSDDLESGCSGPMETFTVAALLALVARPALTLVSAHPA